MLIATNRHSGGWRLKCSSFYRPLRARSQNLQKLEGLKMAKKTLNKGKKLKGTKTLKISIAQKG